MTEDASPKNLRKFLERDDPALRRMGLSMAKGSGVPEDLYKIIFGLSLWDPVTDNRHIAKSLVKKIGLKNIPEFPGWLEPFNKKGQGQRYTSVTGTNLDEKVRLAAVKAMVKIGDERAVEPLIKALWDNFSPGSDYELNLTYGNSVLPSGRVKEAAVDALVRIGKPAVEPLTKVLKRPNQKLLWKEHRKVAPFAAQALGTILADEGAVEPLIKALGYRDVAPLAAQALGTIGDERAVEPLIDIAGNVDREYTSWAIRQAAYALGKIGDTRAVDPLIEALDVGSGYVEGSKEYIVARGGEDDQSDRLWEARDAFVEALGEIGDAHAVEALIDALGDHGVREGAAEALRKISEVAVEPLINGLATSAKTKEYLHLNADILVHILERCMGFEKFYHKPGWLQVWRKIGEPAVQPLIEALGDDEWYVRWYAVMALGEIGDALAVEPLNELLGDESEYVRKYAVDALGKIGDTRALEPLIGVLSDDDLYVRTAATKILGKIGDTLAVEPLIELLGDKNVNVLAAEALGKIGDARAVEPLIKALRSNIRWDAAKALGEIGDARAVEPLIKALKDGRTAVECRSYAAEALGKIGDAPGAIEPLIKALETIEEELGDDGWSDVANEPEYFDEEWELYRSSLKRTVWALGEIGDVRAVEPLIEALDSDEESAGEALRKLGAAGVPFPDDFSNYL